MDSALGPVLERLGLTKVQSRVFAALVHLERASIGQVISLTQLHRGTVYNVLQSLISKGVVGVIKEGDRTFYVASPSAFFSILKREAEDLAEKNKLVHTIIDAVRSCKLVEREESAAIIHFGTDAYRNLFESMITQSGRQEGVFFQTSRGGLIFDRIGPSFYKFTQYLKKEVGARSEVLLGDDKRKHGFASHMKNVNVKWIDYKTPASLAVYKDTVLLTDWSTNPITNVVINNKNIAKLNKSQFRFAWKNIGLKPEEY
jgi:sugar-specific transcriptional regulator TrmB